MLEEKELEEKFYVTSGKKKFDLKGVSIVKSW